MTNCSIVLQRKRSLSVEGTLGDRSKHTNYGKSWAGWWENVAAILRLWATVCGNRCVYRLTAVECMTVSEKLQSRHSRQRHEMLLWGIWSTYIQLTVLNFDAICSEGTPKNTVSKKKWNVVHPTRHLLWSLLNLLEIAITFLSTVNMFLYGSDDYLLIYYCKAKKLKIRPSLACS